jgi:hypothetical protein
MSGFFRYSIPLSMLPTGVKERVAVVADETARFALTTDTVQLGDCVKQNDTGVMYFVIDEANLGNANGYEVFAAGTAADSELLNGQNGAYYLALTNATGTLADARLSSNVDLLDGNQTITGTKTIADGTYLYIGSTGSASVRMKFDNEGELFGIEPRVDGLYNGDTLYYDGLSNTWSINGWTIIDESRVDDTPVNGEISEPISSNWAYTHANAADPHAGYMLESNIGTTANKYLKLNSSAQIPAVSGALLTNLNATNLASGTVSKDRLDDDVKMASDITWTEDPS